MRLEYLLPHELATAIHEGWALIVPAGVIEYHGPHMALGLDTLLVAELAERVAAETKCVVAPPFWYGPTGSAVTGPKEGTLDVSTERFGRHVKDVLASFWAMGFKWIIVCIHHQGLEGPEALAIRLAAAEVTFENTLKERGESWWGKAPLAQTDNVFERIQVWPSVLPEAAQKGVVMADHAGFYETSLLMAIRPDLVQTERISSDGPWFCLTPDSDARSATVENGERMWAAMVDAWVARITSLVSPTGISPQEETKAGAV